METNALVKIVEQSGLDKQKQDYLLEKFSDYTALAAEWEKKAKEIVVTDESQKDLMAMAREGRLLLRDKRVDVEKTRKKLKADSLNEGRTIDEIAKSLTALIEPTEKYLDEQEKFAERKEAERIKALQSERYELLKPYLNEYDLVAPMEYGKMHEKQFDALFAGYKATYEKKVADEKKAEEDRIAQQKADEEAREAQRIENERLKKEAKELEDKFAAAQEQVRKEKEESDRLAKIEWDRIAEERRKEKEKNDEIIRANKEATEKLQAELKAQRDEEERQKLEQEKLESAPDKEKLKQLADLLAKYPLPELKSKKYRGVIQNVNLQLASISDYILKNIK
jgi:hypothetical protein